jgi:hypothetical protein
MDSMRHLSTSLPRNRRQLDTPGLLADFKAAALSVTNLYKTAAASQDKARAAGYQDAVEDLLAFLDQENLGLMDGEGWRVRQWATERLIDDGSFRQGEDDVDEEKKDDSSRYERAASRSSSPEMQRKVPPMPADSSEVHEETGVAAKRQATSEPPSVPVQPAPTSETFTFRSSHAYPTNHDREGTMDLDAASTAPATPTSTSTTTPDSAPTRFVPRSRGSRHGRRSAAQPTTSNNSATISLNLGTGAGSKRKLPYPDFFDVPEIHFEGYGSKDNGYGNGGSKGGKRGRHV